MRSVFAISLAFFGTTNANVLLAASPSSPPSPADPTITSPPQFNFELFRKQNDNRFMGWLSLSDGSYSSQQCDEGGTLYQTGSLWRCCATTAATCNIARGCVSGSLIYSIASTGTVQMITRACTSIFTAPEDQSFTVCNSGFLYENTQDSDPQTNVFCGLSSVNWSYYRVKPESSTPPASTPSSSPAKTTSPSSPTTSSPGPTSATSSPGSDPTPKKKKSQAWIAGAVAGPLIGLALVGGLIWFCLARRKKDKPLPPPSTAAPSYPASPHQQPPQPYNNYPPPMQQNQQGLAPYGAASVTKHESWVVPNSPHTQGSTSPHPPNSPYGAPPVQPQQWQNMQQPQQMYPQQGYAQPGYAQQGFTQSPPHSPAPQVGYVDEQGVNKPMEPQQFSSELDGTSYPQHVQPVQPIQPVQPGNPTA